MNYVELKAEYYAKRNGQDAESVKNKRMEAIKRELQAIKEEDQAKTCRKDN